MDGILALGAVELVEGYRTGRFTPVDAVEAALRRADDVQRKLNAFVRIDTEGALAEARASAPAGTAANRPVCWTASP